MYNRGSATNRPTFLCIKILCVCDLMMRCDNHCFSSEMKENVIFWTKRCANESLQLFANFLQFKILICHNLLHISATDTWRAKQQKVLTGATIKRRCRHRWLVARSLMATHIQSLTTWLPTIQNRIGGWSDVVDVISHVRNGLGAIYCLR